jgi:hypothetical protein
MGKPLAALIEAGRRMMFRILISRAVAHVNRLKSMIIIGNIPIIPYGVFLMRMRIVKGHPIVRMSADHILIAEVLSLLGGSLILGNTRIDHHDDMARSLHDTGVMVELPH